MHKDDQLYMEAYDALLECWTTLLDNASKFPADFFKPHVTQIFNLYLQCHLGAPDGLRNLVGTKVETCHAELQYSLIHQQSFPKLS